MKSSATTCLGMLKTLGLSGNRLQQMLLQGLVLLAAMSKGLKVLVSEVRKVAMERLYPMLFSCCL